MNLIPFQNSSKNVRKIVFFICAAEILYKKIKKLYKNFMNEINNYNNIKLKKSENTTKNQNQFIDKFVKNVMILKNIYCSNSLSKNIYKNILYEFIRFFLTIFLLFGFYVIFISRSLRF